MVQPTYFPAIVIPAFRRAGSLKRLLISLDEADALGRPHLVISLEGGATPEVVAVAETFARITNKYRARICSHQSALGLRNHILECGSYALEFGSVIVLEDDIYVDRYFYQYASSALSNYDGDERVAGIALYAPQVNEFCGLPFRPRGNGYSTYWMQTACSWGQAWSARQWNDFIKWYKVAQPSDVDDDLQLPKALRNWPESSWKKYFAAYLVTFGKGVVYPYESYTTNFSDAGGTHIVDGTDRYNVDLAVHDRPAPSFTFSPTFNPEVAYDAYMEPCGASLVKELGCDLSEITIDTYGIKPLELLRTKPLALTVRPMARKVKEFAISRRPIEANIDANASPSTGLAMNFGPSNGVTAIRHKPSYAEYAFRYAADFSNAKLLRAIIIVVSMMLLRRLLNRLARS